MTEKGEGSRAGRRMFVQVEVDATARADQVWRLEFRWFMCRGTKVEGADSVRARIRRKTAVEELGVRATAAGHKKAENDEHKRDAREETFHEIPIRKK